MRDLRVVVGQFGGLSTLTRSVAQSLRADGAKVIALDELDPSVQAAAANRHAAHVYVGFEAHATEHAVVSYYSTEGFHSAGGQSLASRLVHALGGTGVTGGVRAAGMRLPVLRETRMTAAVCSLGPVQRISDAAGRHQRRRRGGGDRVGRVPDGDDRRVLSSPGPTESCHRCPQGTRRSADPEAALSTGLSPAV